VFLLSGLCGFLNGLIVTKSKSEPLIITLGMSFFYNGLALVITDGGFLSLKGHLAWLGSGSLLGIPVPVLVLFILMILTHFILKFTKYGRRLHLIGANEEMAYLSGIAVDQYKIINYTIAGFITGVATLVLVARLGNILAGSGNGYEFRALSAAIIGGVTFEGAIGDVPGVFLGAILLGVVSNAMNVLGVSAFYQTAVMGLIIVVAVTISNINKKKRNKA
jgi:ribose/xylose/arabinose/galactoside ABC-type transport system permease subunit